MKFWVHIRWHLVDAAEALAVTALGMLRRQPIDEDVITSAAVLAKTHRLRSLDAIQLASALAIKRRSKTELLFVSADRALLKAASQERLEVFDPTGPAA